MSQPWDAGKPVAARGRYYVSCVANGVRTLQIREGAAGDELDWIWLFPTTVTPGAATLSDGGGAVWTWPAGITLSDNRPIFVPLNLRSRVGAWTLTLPTTFNALAAGAFQ